MATKPVPYYTGTSADPIRLQHLLRKRFMVMIRLVNAEGPRVGQELDKVLNSKQFSDHVQKIVKEAMQDSLSQQTGLWQPNAAPFQKVPQSIFEPIPQMYWDNLQKSPSWKAVESSLSTLEQDWDRTPCGAWLAEHPNGTKWLAVSGGLLAAAGLASMYTPKRADFVAKHLINGQKFDVVKSGFVDLKVSPEINMTAKEFGMQSEMTLKLDGLEVKSDLSAKFKTGFLEECSHNAVVKIPLGKWNASVGMFENAQQDGHVELGLGYKDKDTSLDAKFKTDGFDAHSLTVSGSAPLWKTAGWKGSLSGSGATDFDSSHSCSLLLSNEVGKKSSWKVKLGVELSSKSQPKGTIGVAWDFGSKKK